MAKQHKTETPEALAPVKTPRLDAGFHAQKPQREAVASMLTELKPTSGAPLADRDSRFGEHQAAEYKRREDYQAGLRAADPREQVAEQKRLERERTMQRAKELDVRLNLLRGNIEAITNAFRPFGVGTAPEAMGAIDHALTDLTADVIEAMKADGITGAEKLIADHEAALPELRERVNGIQNRWMTNVAAQRAAANAEVIMDEARRLGPDRALAALESSGVRLRVIEGVLETAGPLGEREMAILKLYRDATIERVAARENWRRA